jgi:GT2 family glycosyltransferase
MRISGSIVLFNNDIEKLNKAINSFLNTSEDIRLYLIDNSINDRLEKVVNDNRIHYIHNPSNPGFGAAHNIAIRKSIEIGSKYHFVINPDVYFFENVIESMVRFADLDKTIGMMMPQILNDDGSIQNLPKLLPSPLSVLMRKVKMPKFYYKEFINRYELRFVDKSKIYNAPILSGCFTLFNVEALQNIGGYDDSYFMYFEDWDLSRRMHNKYKTIYFPEVSVYHGYESGANKNSQLFKIFINSAINYFNKWGWFFDKERLKINETTLKQFDK